MGTWTANLTILYHSCPIKNAGWRTQSPLCRSVTGCRRCARVRKSTYSASIPHVATGFATLDQMTGCQGIPLGAITLLSGRTTSGKLTLAYKLLANAQRASHGGVAYTVGLVDLNRTADPDYLARCGVDLEHLLVARPQTSQQAVDHARRSAANPATACDRRG